MVISFDITIEERGKPPVKVNLSKSAPELYNFAEEERTRTYIAEPGVSERISLQEIISNLSNNLIGVQIAGPEVGMVKLGLITNQIKFLETLSQRVDLGSALLSLTNTISTSFTAVNTDFFITNETPIATSLSNDLAIKVGNPTIVGIGLTANQLSLNNELRFGLPSNMVISEDIDVP